MLVCEHCQNVSQCTAVLLQTEDFDFCCFSPHGRCRIWCITMFVITVFLCCVSRKAGLSTGLTLQGTVHPELAQSGELVC